MASTEEKLKRLISDLEKEGSIDAAVLRKALLMVSVAFESGTLDHLCDCMDENLRR